MGTRGLADGTVLLLGGRSEIGLEVARRLAPGRAVVLAARRSGELDAQRAQIAAAGASEVHAEGEHRDADRPVLGDQQRAERDPAHAAAILHTDFVAQASVLTTLANLMRARGAGQLVVFSSVAGVRVRRANYVYGSAKAGLDGFASGLADALHGSGVRLLLVRPGFVIGRMTEGMSPAPFSSTPDQVAGAVVAGLRRGASRVWVPRMLQPVFFAMRLLPQPIWRRMPR
jgi:short-subunit dehydrogenase